MRRTGRTTRLLQDVIHLASEGKHVVVVSEGNTLLNVFSNMPIVKQVFKRRPVSGGYVHISNGTIDFLHPENRHIDWYNLTIRGSQKEIFLVDHYVIERKFKKLIEMLHRYDEIPDCSPAKEVNLPQEVYDRLIKNGKKTPNPYCKEDDDL